MSQEPQPQDEWTFLRPDEFVDDDEVERVDAASERPPEVGAMHVERATARTVHDPGRADVDTGSDVPGEGPVTYFDDEEPEEGRSTSEPEHEPDLEEILESQHYSFDQTETETET